MKFLPIISLLTPLILADVPGFDISNWQETVDFPAAYSSGARFVIMKASEGSDWKDKSFDRHWAGATEAGFIRGAYHFARPDFKSGGENAKWFIDNGGKWVADGITLPGTLDIEYGPRSTCYNISTTAMITWIADFVDTYKSLSGRYPMIYTTNDWWKTCTANTDRFSATCPLFLARYGSTVGTIPGGWAKHTIWQFNDSYPYGGDSDTFNGDLEALKQLALG